MRCTVTALVFAALSAFLAIPAHAGVRVEGADMTPVGYELVEGDIYVPAGMQKGTVWEPNIWPSGIVPYVFLDNLTGAVFSYTSATLTFATNPPRIISSDGNDLFVTQGFRAGDMLLVQGSSANDNGGSTLYIVDSINESTLWLDPSTTIQAEGAGLSVTLSNTASVSPVRQQLMLDAMAEWESIGDIHFIPRTTEQNYVRIMHSAYNRATIGKPDAGETGRVEITSWSNKWIICHELAHCMTIKHEQARPDRDLYVTINFENVSTTLCGGPCGHNFWATATGRAYPVEPFGGIYDFDSVMHYGQYDFSIDPGVLTTIDCNPGYQAYQGVIGQRTHLSYWDKKIMSFVYAQPDWRFLHAESTTVNPAGTFDNPSKDLSVATTSVPAGGRLVILYPDSYSYSTSPVRVLNTPMEIEAPTGGVILQ